MYRRMEDIREAEVESVADLTAFLDAELAYYDNCREILLQLKREWPAASTTNGRKPTRPRPNTSQSYAERFEPVEEEEAAPKIVPKIASRTDSPARPVYHRSVTIDDPAPRVRDYSPIGSNKLPRMPTESAAMLARATLRPTNRTTDVADEESSSGRSDSPTTPFGRIPSRTTSWSTDVSTGAKKAPPPPPPSRSKKPPPPPPMKRSAPGMS